MKKTLFFTGAALYLSSKGSEFLYEMNDTMLFHYLVFVGFALCAKLLLIDILLPEIRAYKKKMKS